MYIKLELPIKLFIQIYSLGKAFLIKFSQHIFVIKKQLKKIKNCAELFFATC